MIKRGLIVDSSSGLTMKHSIEKGIYFIPLTITIAEKTYFSGENINEKEVEDLMDKNNKIKIKTSTPTGSKIRDAYDAALKKYDEVVVLTISHKFSGTNNSCRLIAEESEYKGKIHVYKSQYSSPWTYCLIDDINDIVKNGTSIKRIYELLDQQKEWMIGFLSPGNIYWFYRGGRITKMQYIIGSLAKITPILIINDGMIDQSKIIKIRKGKKIHNMMGDLIEKEIKRVTEAGLDYKIYIANSNNKSIIEEQYVMIEQRFKVKREDVLKRRLSPDQTSHLGPNGIGISLVVNFKEKI
ncbi:MAG: DegV family EDD domain-containing protein [Mycoplasmataceae bacterium]|nr:DegV family EDD domain-containing protein [Mycoplasmataceae bacterium]